MRLRTGEAYTRRVSTQDQIEIGANPVAPGRAAGRDILAGLNAGQFAAASHAGGPLLIVAGPGSGKTRVMAHRVAYLIGHENVPPWRILAVTFTNKAARELRERCERLVSGSAGRLQVFTFHGFCARVLRQDGEHAGLKPGFTIYDDDDQTRTMKRILEDLQVDTKQTTAASVLHRISDAKNRMMGPEMFAERIETYKDEVVARAYSRYQAVLFKANAVDFDDLLLKVFMLLSEHPDVLVKWQDRYRYFLIDEFQDTNPLQFEVARLLASRDRNICVVGDPDQSIYSWRHADPTNLHEFLRVWPDAKVVTLDQSYRSSQTILSAADAVISKNSGRLEKNLWTENPKGLPVAVAEAYDEDEEARLVLDEAQRLVEKEGIPRREIAVMYRINAQSRAMEVACNRQGVPYRLVGGVKFYERAEVKDVLAYLRAVSNPADDAALDRIINTPSRGISERTVSELRRASIVNNMTMLEVVFASQDEAGAGRGPLSMDLQARALKAVGMFGDLMKRLIEQSLVLQPTELIDLVLERTGYLKLLKDDQEKGEERTENVRELRGTAEQFTESQGGADPRENLAAFLENVALVSDVDDMDKPGRRRTPSPLQGEGQGVGRTLASAIPSPSQGEGEGEVRASLPDPITLITMHQAKGLEFDAVFIVGMEEGLLPHSRSLEDPAQLQEERRICYVGMTRARKRLYLLHAFQRSFRGSRMASEPSRFLAEIPASLVSKRAIRNMGRRGNIMPDPVAAKHAASVPAPRIVSKAKLALSAGDRVRHGLFGDGVVVSAREVGDDVEVTVAFAGKGVKKLLLSFAPLEKVSVTKRDDPANPLPEVAEPGLDGP